MSFDPVPDGLACVLPMAAASMTAAVLARGTAAIGMLPVPWYVAIDRTGGAAAEGASARWLLLKQVSGPRLADFAIACAPNGDALALLLTGRNAPAEATTLGAFADIVDAVGCIASFLRLATLGAQ